MNNEKAIRLLERHRRGALSPLEEQRLNEWYLIEVAGSPHSLSAEQIERTHGQIRSGLPLQEGGIKVFLWRRIAAVFAMVALLGYGLYFFARPAKVHNPSGFSAGTEALPGKSGATLTLGNGRKINLSNAPNGRIASEPGVTVTKTADGKLLYQPASAANISPASNTINTLTTANGQTYILVLPDGSRVWMNSASSISYPASFSGAALRKVKVDGELYFEVAKDKAHPFVVESRAQQIRVLGTHFNINAYQNEPLTATTLLEGAVGITTGKQVKLLKPGQQALTKGAEIFIVQANADNVTDWKQGDFYLNHVEFKTAMRKIARWYDVEIIFDPSLPDDIEPGGWISRDQKLSTVLKLIASSGQVHFRIAGKKVFVSTK
jgi:transmembrane sensor